MRRKRRGIQAGREEETGAMVRMRVDPASAIPEERRKEITSLLHCLERNGGRMTKGE
jgi:hypothetical protein